MFFNSEKRFQVSDYNVHQRGIKRHSKRFVKKKEKIWEAKCVVIILLLLRRADEQSEHMLSGQTGSVWTAVYRRLHQETLISLIITVSQIKGKDCKWSSEKFKGKKKKQKKKIALSDQRHARGKWCTRCCSWWSLTMKEGHTPDKDDIRTLECRNKTETQRPALLQGFEKTAPLQLEGVWKKEQTHIALFLSPVRKLDIL